MPDHNNDNLIVYVNPDPNYPSNPNGGVYSLPPKIYTDPKYAMSPDTAGGALALLSFGTVVANIPSDLTGLGGMCYLINLPALKPPPVNPNPRLTAPQLMNMLKSLLRNTQEAVPGTADRKIADAMKHFVETFESHG